MASLVLELQQDALNPKVPVSNLLRKAVVIARKLGLRDPEQWIQLELNGYGDTAAKDIPAYRKIHGEVKALNPFRGWQPVRFEDPKMDALVSTTHCSLSIAELESVLDSVRGGNGGGTLTIPFSPSQEAQLRRAIHMDTEVTLFVQASSLTRVLDAARTAILEWALKLEQDGVRGEGMTFTPDEKQKVAAPGSHSINFFGPVYQSQIQHGTQSSVQVQAADLDLQLVREFISALKDRADALPLPGDQKAELGVDIETVETQLRSPRPKAAVLRESLRSIRNVLEGAAGSVIAAELLKLLASALGITP